MTKRTVSEEGHDGRGALHSTRKWLRENPGWSAITVALLIVAIVFANANTAVMSLTPRASWVVTALLGTVAIAAIGASVNGRPAGVLIDNRNRVSLSKFQATIWTILILSVLITAVSMNLNAGVADPVSKINIPGELLLAMGISATSLVATPMLLSLKMDQVAAADAVIRTADKLDLAPSQIRSTGRVFARATPKLASWADMFRGDETSNAGDADLSKVQQFMISLLLVGVYASAVWALLGKVTQVGDLPKLSENFVWLMGISHASYLIYKAAPHGGGGTAAATTADPTFEPVG